MAKLTNLQMTVLANRVVDVLEEDVKKRREELSEKDEYKNFLKYYTDENTEKLTEIKNKSLELEEKLKILTKELTDWYYKTNNMQLSVWGDLSTRTEHLLRDYLNSRKTDVYPNTKFDREKMLTKVQADIILSDVSDPETLVKGIVEKFKAN